MDVIYGFSHVCCINITISGRRPYISLPERPVYVRICSLEVQNTASSFGWTDDVLFNQQSEDGWKVLLGIKPHCACLWGVYFREVCSGSDKMKQKKCTFKTEAQLPGALSSMSTCGALTSCTFLSSNFFYAQSLRQKLSREATDKKDTSSLVCELGGEGREMLAGVK